MREQDELLKYYIKHADTRFDRLELQVERLISFRWMLIGAASGASAVVSLCFELVRSLSKGQ